MVRQHRRVFGSTVNLLVDLLASRTRGPAVAHFTQLSRDCGEVDQPLSCNLVLLLFGTRDLPKEVLLCNPRSGTADSQGLEHV